MIYLHIRGILIRKERDERSEDEVGIDRGMLPGENRPSHFPHAGINAEQLPCRDAFALQNSKPTFTN